MAVETSSNDSDLSLALVNIFLGLLQGNRMLKPHHHLLVDLGYKLFGVETTIRLRQPNGNVTPEAIAYSIDAGHTLITEWTEQSEVTASKRTQLTKYLAISSTDLNEAGVDSLATRANGIWYVVTTNGLSPYRTEVGQVPEVRKRLILSVASFVPDGGVTINYVLGHFADDLLSARLSSPLQFHRVPQGYVPVSLTRLNTPRFAAVALQQIVSFMVKGQSRFSTEDIASGMFPIWANIDPGLRTTVRGAIKDVVNQLLKQKYCPWIRRAEERFPHTTWDIRLPHESDAPLYLRRLRAHMSHFYDQLTGLSGQVTIWDFMDRQKEVQGRAASEKRKRGGRDG